MIDRHAPQRTWTRSTSQGLALAIVLAISATSVRDLAADAPAGRYSIASGVVTDNVTKLSWQQQLGQGNMTWSDAASYCQQLDLNGTGWRLPSVKELQTLVDRSRENPSIDVSAFPGSPAEFFWSSSPLAASSSTVWNVSFKYGSTGGGSLTSTYLVRCVK